MADVGDSSVASGSVFRVVLLLEGEMSPQIEVKGALVEVSIQDDPVDSVESSCVPPS